MSTSRSQAWVQDTTRFFAWRGGLGDGAGDVAALIAERPTSIVVTRQDPVTHVKTVLAAQTVRVDLDTRLNSTVATSPVPSAGLTVKQRFVILGYKGNATVADTNLAFGDVFLLDGQQVVVKNVEINFTDRLLAQAEATN